MFRTGLCAGLATIAILGTSGLAVAAERTYINTTGEELVIYLRPVQGQQYGAWFNSGTIENEKSWTVQVSNPPSYYDFTLHFPKSKETRSLGVKTVASPDPITVAVERRQRIKQQQRHDDAGRNTLSDPPPQMEEYFELVPVKPQGK